MTGPWRDGASGGTPITAAELNDIQAEVDKVGPIGESVDALADLVNTGRLSDEALAGSYAPIVSVLSFVNAGETFNVDGTANGNNSAVMQRAVDALSTAYVADGRPRQVDVPAGIIRLATQVEWKTGVGVKGAGRGRTVFLPQGTQAAFNYEPTDGTFIADTIFSDFTINGADQASTSTDSKPKGFRFLFTKRVSVKAVNVVNTWATGFGFDGCDGVIDDCYAYNCGRCHTRDADGMAAGNGFGSGFGIGIGARAYEPLVISNCVSDGSGTNGFFLEHLVNRAEFLYHSRGFRLVNCSASGNKHGFLDAGASGATVTGCSFVGNLYAGVNLRSSFNGTTPGTDGVVSQCVIAANGLASVNTGSNVNSGGGVVFGTNSAGRYTFENNRVLDNNGPGFWSTSLTVLGPGVKIRNNIVRGNAKSGLLFENSSITIDDLAIENNECSNNGSSSSISYRDGITIRSSTTRPSIVGNRCFDDRTSKFQNRGLDVQLSTRNMVQARIARNNFFGNQVEGYRNTQIIVDAALIGTDNIVTDPVVGNGYWSDDFERADGALGTTSVGARPWSSSGTGVGAIVSGKLGTAAALAAGARGIDSVASGLADGVFRATCVVVGVNSTAELVFRAQDYNNYLGIAARIDSSNRRWQFRKRVAGTGTTIVDLGVASANGDAFVITMSGTTITIALNGTQVYTGTVTEFATETRCGQHRVGTNPNNDTTWDSMSLAAA